MNDVRYSYLSQYPFIDLNLYQYNYEKCNPLSSVGPSVRDHYFFLYVLEGEGSVSVIDSDNEKEYTIKKGEGIIVFPEEVITLRAEGEEPWEYVWIEFDGIIVKEALIFAGLNKNNPVYIPDGSEASKKLEKTLMQLSYSSEESELKKVGELYFFLDYLTQSSSSEESLKGQRLNDYYIREISHFVEEHFNENITVEKMAEHLNLSRGYLNKIFKKYTGKSPKEFLTNYRMAKATQLLKTTKLPIREVGNAVGYHNQLHFSRAFKNYFGIPPKTYREANRIEKN